MWNRTTSYHPMTDIKCKVAEAPKIEERLLLFAFLSYLTINYSNIFRIFQITFFYGLNNSAILLLKFLQSTLPKLHCPLVYPPFLSYVHCARSPMYIHRRPAVEYMGHNHWWAGTDSNRHCTDFKSVASYLLRYPPISAPLTGLRGV